ncbi:MAG: calcium-transporting P-type ATPase, PMR1-type [Clostridia bacterium]|nr:calcium-transporting P-type ATPase, PMR1-type [Clostridia bacterium]
MGDKYWYRYTAEQALETLKSDKERGLGDKRARQRLEEHGYNQIKSEKKTTILNMFLSQFKNFMVIILLIAAVISGFLGELNDTIIIITIVVLNAVLGVLQENKAEKALEALKNMSIPSAKVIRDGNTIQVKSTHIVPGDIVILEAGDFIPADGRIVECSNLMVEESSLTGESVPVQKHQDVIQDRDIPLGDMANMVFSTGLVTNGRAKIVVTGTGMDTEIGKIAQMIEQEDNLKTPLQIKLEELGKWLGLVAIAVCAIIFLVGFFQGRDMLEMFMLAVSLAVAAIPEGLPAIVTIVLSLGVQRMIKKNAIIRKLPAVETLGTASVICSDKTGTLTQNKMTVTAAYIYDTPMEDINEIRIQDKLQKLLLDIGLLCNDASIQAEPVGDPTEIALLDLAYKKGLVKQEQEKIKRRVQEIPFDSDRKLMSTIHSYQDKYYVFTKGALDVLLDRCSRVLTDDGILTIDQQTKNRIMEQNNKMSQKALRVLAMGYKEIDVIPDDINPENTENDLVFVGMMGMIDPPREEVKLAVEKCRLAGIKPVMITGDYKNTAVAIAEQLGIFKTGDIAVDGVELEKMTDEQLSENIHKHSVFARVSPHHKVRIVKAWQSKGRVVAMTGDGVNDAPALKSADIGCAMGITGTDVSKQASDMILTDDNFATIVDAVEEGRGIFDNIKKSIHFLLSCNIGEIITLFIALLFNMPAPLLPIHILWINLITDSLPALSLGVDPIYQDIMKRKPRDPKESIFSQGLGVMILVEGIIIGSVTLLAFNRGLKYNIDIARTMAFTTLSLSQLIHSLDVRSIDKSVFKIGVFSNKYLIASIFISTLLVLAVIAIPFLRGVFELAYLSKNQIMIVVIYSIIPLIMMEIVKLFKKPNGQN